MVRFSSARLGAMCTALSVLSTFVVGCSGAPTDVDAADQDIVNGAKTSAYPAVVSVSIGGSNHCSGTLIASDLVLTAGHCVFEHAGQPIDVTFGDGSFWASFSSKSISVDSWHVHPGYNPSRAASHQDGDDGIVDLAVLHLSQPYTKAAPIPIGGGVSAGEDLTIVAFGQTSDDWTTFGRMREGHVTVSEVHDGWYFYAASPSLTCGGDSGGAAFDSSGRLVGVISRGRIGCVQGDHQGAFMNPGSYTSWIFSH